MSTIQDISVVWDNRTGQGEWHIFNRDIAMTDAIYSAVMVSLFSDRIAPLEPSANEQSASIGKIDGDRRGWWGDILRDEPIGSRLWQLQRAIKADKSSILLSSKDMIYESLEWMVNDGLVNTIGVAVRWANKGILEFSIELTEPKINSPKTFLFSWAWEGI